MLPGTPNKTAVCKLRTFITEHITYRFFTFFANNVHYERFTWGKNRSKKTN